MTTRTTLPLVLALLGLAACGREDVPATDTPASEPTQEASAGDESSATAAATPVEADCPWLTDAEATEILGAPVTVTQPAGNQAVCDVPYVSGVPGVGLVVREGGFTLDQTRSPFESMGTAETVEGLGDEASWIVQTETQRYLFVAKGDNVVQVTMSTAMPRTDLKEKGEAIARAVLTHL